MDSKWPGLVIQSQGETAGVRLRCGIVCSIGQRLEFRSGTDIHNSSPDLGRLHALEEDPGQMGNGHHIGVEYVLGVFLAPFQNR